MSSCSWGSATSPSCCSCSCSTYEYCRGNSPSAWTKRLEYKPNLRDPNWVGIYTTAGEPCVKVVIWFVIAIHWFVIAIHWFVIAIRFVHPPVAFVSHFYVLLCLVSDFSGLLPWWEILSAFFMKPWTEPQSHLHPYLRLPSNPSIKLLRQKCCHTDPAQELDTKWSSSDLPHLVEGPSVPSGIVQKVSLH